MLIRDFEKSTEIDCSITCRPRSRLSKLGSRVARSVFSDTLIGLKPLFWQKNFVKCFASTLPRGTAKEDRRERRSRKHVMTALGAFPRWRFGLVSARKSILSI